jgi:hypothetical protein
MFNIMAQFYRLTLIFAVLLFHKRLEPLTVGRDGEEWQHFRRIMNRHWLMPGSGYEVIGPCDFVATELVDRWTRKYNGREVIGLESELYRWAIKSEILIKHRYIALSCHDGRQGLLQKSGTANFPSGAASFPSRQPIFQVGQPVFYVDSQFSNWGSQCYKGASNFSVRGCSQKICL